MKCITAYLRANKLEDLKEAMEQAGIYGMSAESVRGYGRQLGHTDKYGGSSYAINLLPKLKVEVVVPDEDVDLATEVITKCAFTGEIGDGKIFISDVIDAVRIRTGERGDAALK